MKLQNFLLNFCTRVENLTWWRHNKTNKVKKVVKNHNKKPISITVFKQKNRCLPNKRVNSNLFRYLTLTQIELHWYLLSTEVSNSIKITLSIFTYLTADSTSKISLTSKLTTQSSSECAYLGSKFITYNTTSDSNQ